MIGNGTGLTYNEDRVHFHCLVADVLFSVVEPFLALMFFLQFLHPVLGLTEIL